MSEVGLYEAILGSGAGGPLTAPTPWITFPGYITYQNGGVVIGNPTGGNKGTGTLNTTGIYVNGAALSMTGFLSITGGTMTGILTLSGNPVGPMDASTKQYVDNNITTVNTTLGNYLLKSGGTLTGSLILAADPTAALGACTKQYADNKFSGLIGISDAPSDGNNYGRKNAVWVDTGIIDVGTY